MIRIGILIISLVLFAWHAWQDIHPPIYIVLNSPHLEETSLHAFLNKKKRKQVEVVNWVKIQPWTKSVAIEKVDSSTYILDIKERQAVAQWQHGGMVDNEGNIFFPQARHYDTKLPTIQVLAKDVRKGISFVNELSPILHKVKGIPFTVFKMDPEGDWVVSLASNRYLLFGTMDLTKRLQVAKLVVKRLHDHHEAWGRIDFRYHNGFAVSKNPLNEPFHWPMIQLSYG